MKPADRYSGRAPHIARSFTVPFTARSPMSPPGKNSGETTNESVVNARRAPFTAKTRRSSSGSSSGLRKASRNSASISVWVAFPPAPCASVIRSSLIRGLRRRARSMRSQASPRGSAASSAHSADVDHARAASFTRSRVNRPKL